VGGEAAALFVPFYAAALAIPPWAPALIVAGTLAGAGAGAVRVSQGAHFVSDVVFAGLFMALTALLVHRLMFAASWPAAPRLPPRLRLRAP
jgi:lipid A 4'-phosphatase